MEAGNISTFDLVEKNQPAAQVEVTLAEEK